MTNVNPRTDLHHTIFAPKGGVRGVGDISVKGVFLADIGVTYLVITHKKGQHHRFKPDSLAVVVTETCPGPFLRVYRKDQRGVDGVRNLRAAAVVPEDQAALGVVTADNALALRERH